jgi:hypothetical protein
LLLIATFSGKTVEIKSICSLPISCYGDQIQFYNGCDEALASLCTQRKEKGLAFASVSRLERCEFYYHYQDRTARKLVLRVPFVFVQIRLYLRAMYM